MPDEFADFYAHFHKLKNHDPKRNVWIVKPAALSRGRGIYIVDDISEINLDETTVVSRYISNPLLINGHKFDLRIYVLVSSFEPLRVYVFKEGLTRFASEPYSNSHSKSNKFVHLTNYSINKKNDNFVQNEVSPFPNISRTANKMISASNGHSQLYANILKQLA
ncbi:hypothetical protein COB52_05110 [Candidatus Kaiserbacteria bacterium]|nr:MAG: hypothetical protein COB52_05110 [Candidatus Kaiserbacteria bacterium]